MRKLVWNFVVIVNFYLILFFWFNNSNYLLAANNPGDMYIAFGRLTGLLSEFLILIELFLISRFSSFEKEYGFDKLVDSHKYIGFALIFLLISHPILLTIGYAKLNGVSLLSQLLKFEVGWGGVFLATVGFVIVILISILSMKKIRQLVPYEVWYFSHIPLYLAIGIAFGHQIISGDVAGGEAEFYWYLLNIAVFGALITYRFVKPLFLFLRHSFTIEKIVKENNDVYSIYITGKHMEKYKFDAGQYATLIFMQKGMWFHHPFSFSDAYNGKDLRFTIKSSGDFTSEIEKLKVGTRVWIDGPLGRFTLRNHIKNKILFIAGGIGITPIISIIKSINNKNNIILLYSNKTEADINFKQEITNSGIEVHYFNTEGDSSKRIDIIKIKEICPDFKERDIYICGPSQMALDLSRRLRVLYVPAEQIHYEKFDY